MANQWFRMYSDFLEDAKIISLAFEDQRHFIGILALKGAGLIDQECAPEIMDRLVAQKLWVDRSSIVEVKRRLVEVGLIDINWQPLAWEKRQFVSDRDPTAAERQQRKRDRDRELKEEEKRHGGVTRDSHGGVTPGVTDPSHRSDTDSDSDSDSEEISSLSPSSPSPPAAADAAGVSERSDPAPTPTAQAATDAPPPRSAPKPKVTPWPRFDDFWSAYPNKKAKEDARRAWNRMRPPPDVIDTILADLPHRATSDRSWLDGYIPNPATYLNGRRWEDVITPTTAVKTNGSRVVSLAERNAAVFDDFLRGTGTNGIIEGECQRV